MPQRLSSSLLSLFVLYFGALLLGAGVVYLFFSYSVFSSSASAGASTESFEVERGANIRTIAKRLEERGFIRRWWSILLLSRASTGSAEGAKPTTVRAGEYRLSASMTPREILRKLMDGDVVYHEVTIPEGTSIRDLPALLAKTTLVSEIEVKAQLDRKDLPATLNIPADSLEGYVFPDTYKFTRPDNAEFMIRHIVQVGNDKRSKEFYERAIDLGFTFNQILTIASIIEKETGAPDERPTISSVFHNRLRIGMPLQSDPTVIYGLQDFNGNLTREHLTTPSPYNTYLNTGLPPTPICNPGLESIRAALYPGNTDYLYFVAKGDGTHQFSATYREHAQAVQRYQRGGGALTGTQQPSG